MPSPSSRQATTFHYFPSLPSELRLKIWEAACCSRILTLTYTSSTNKFTCTAPPPCLLSVSRESRKEALRTYHLTFGTTSHAPKIYYNPYRDVLYKPRHREMGYDDIIRDIRSLVIDPEGVLDEVRYIAIDHVNPDVKRPWESYNKASFIRNFKQLKEVFLVLDHTSASDATSAATPDPGLSPGADITLVEPKQDPESLLKIWYYFKQTFLAEESILEEACKEDEERIYEKFELPTLRIKERVRKTGGGFVDEPHVDEVVEGTKRVLEGILL